jgi:opacity protein-like surface antigen
MKKLICGAVAALATMTVAMSAQAAPGASPTTGGVSALVTQAGQDIEHAQWRRGQRCTTRRIVTWRFGRRHVRVVRSCGRRM